MKNKPEEKKHFRSKLIENIRRCVICNQPIIVTCDKTKKSELVRFDGSTGSETKPQFMWMYPTAKEQSNLCFYHRTQKEAAINNW